jgi:hypothetical protein
MDLMGAGSSPEDSWDNLLLWQGFLHPLRACTRGFHDQLKQRPSSLFMLLGCSSISKASLIIQSMYLDLEERVLVSWELDVMAPGDNVSGHSRYVWMLQMNVKFTLGRLAIP